MTGTVKSFHDLPRWVWEMVAALQQYEDEHDSPRLHHEDCSTRPHMCACSVVGHVPEEVRAIALVAAQWRDADKVVAPVDVTPRLLPVRVVLEEYLPPNVSPDTECVPGLLMVGTVVYPDTPRSPGRAGKVAVDFDHMPGQLGWYDPSQLLVVEDRNGLVRITREHPLALVRPEEGGE